MWCLLTFGRQIIWSMFHSLTCRCLLRPVSASKCSLILTTALKGDCVMMAEQRLRNQASFHGSLHRSQSYESQRGRCETAGTAGERSRHHQGRSASTHHRLNSMDSDYCHTHGRVEEERLRHRLSFMRRWEYTSLGDQLKKREIKQPKNSVEFSVLSYNVLAQELLEQHLYLYRHVSSDALHWENRAERLLREFKDSKADILCLQEVQSNHYDTFYLPKLQKMGFQGLYKKRTGDKPDGCAIFYRTSKFQLREAIDVEYCKPGVQLLDRDNIALLALLIPRRRNCQNASEAPFICVATTHLLYNPKRYDIKLAQLQLLFAELDKIAYMDSDGSNHRYHPVILTGDFNLTPESNVYRFVTQGALQYEGLGKGKLVEVDPSAAQYAQKKELIPPHLNVTDQCQHRHIAENRSAHNAKRSRAEIDMSFSSGLLTHQLRLQSVYSHRLNRRNGCDEVTAYQNRWVTVDYIFHKYMHIYLINICERLLIWFLSSCSGGHEKNPSLHLLGRLGLLAGEEVDSLGGLPNLATPSDHLPLASSFLWQYE